MDLLEGLTMFSLLNIQPHKPSQILSSEGNWHVSFKVNYLWRSSVEELEEVEGGISNGDCQLIEIPLLIM